jgi:hypothetical protein
LGDFLWIIKGESKYLLHFTLVENYYKKEEYDKVVELADEIGAMLWKLISSLK